MVYIRKLTILSGEQRAPGHHLDTGRFAATEDVPSRITLHGHGTEEDKVGPPQVFFGQRGDVGINQPLLPLLRQQRRHGDQPQRGAAGLLADKTQGILEAPEGRWKLWINV